MGGKVSVIIPAYNAANFLAETVKSILGQSYQDFELLIVDDGSKDNTASIAELFSKDPRVKLISQTNLGCSGAKNTGLMHITGDYVQYLDADDILSPDKLKDQVAAIDRSKTDLAVCRTAVFHREPGDTNIEIDTNKLFSTRNGIEFLLNLYGLREGRGMIQPNAFLMTRKLS
ncbi:MAG: glycosyltransferase family 2 protein, partial [Chitinophagaceae bacterium]